MATESRTFDDVPVKGSKWRLMPVGVTGSWIVDDENRLVGTIHESEDAKLAAAAPDLLEACKSALCLLNADAHKAAANVLRGALESVEAR